MKQKLWKLKRNNIFTNYRADQRQLGSKEIKVFIYFQTKINIMKRFYKVHGLFQQS